MSHVPNFLLRESLGRGCVGTGGVHDAASPDNGLFCPVTPGTLGCNGMHSQSVSSRLDVFQRLMCRADSDSISDIFSRSIGGGLMCLASAAYQLPAVVSKTPQRMKQTDFERAAAELNCEVAAVKAVAEVESRGSGFLPDGRPKILFEAHHFARLTKQQYNLTHPNISSKRWSKSLYLGGAKEYDRLKEAMLLDPPAAIQSASWGAFQIMGFNYVAAGFKTPAEFVNAQYVSEGEHLKAFLGFVKSVGLLKHIQMKNWEAFAKGYNGPKYKENNYDGQLAKAYEKHSKPIVLPKPQMPKK